MNMPAIISPSPPPWLAGAAAAALGAGEGQLQLDSIAGDAGSRCYYRVTVGAASYIAATDSALAQQQTFIRLQALFAAAGVRTPAIVAQTQQQSGDSMYGLLLLEDFGDTTYYRHLPADADTLYTAAIQTAVQIQSSTALAAALPPYDAAALHGEMQLFSDWYCNRYLSRPLSAAAAKIVAAAASYLANAMSTAPPVAVHRDYHSRNLMYLNTAPRVGVLDFQDAVSGSALYDIVSLLRDAYVEWQPQQQEQWLRQYWQAAVAANLPAGDSFEECSRQFNIAGAQRGLKVVGIFARLAYRDNKTAYLNDIPLAYKHLIHACNALPALSPLADVLADMPPR